jgi:hypothetical protein
VKNRPPVPLGLVESTQYNSFQGEPYIPPPVPEIPSASGSDTYAAPTSSTGYSNTAAEQNEIHSQDKQQYNHPTATETSNNEIYNQGLSTVYAIPAPESYQHLTQTVSVNNAPQESNSYSQSNPPSISNEHDFGAPQQAFDLNQHVEENKNNPQQRDEENNNYQPPTNNNYQQPESNNYQQPENNNYQQSVNNNYQQSENNNYQQSTNGNYQQQQDGVDVNDIVKSLGLEGSSVVGSKSVDYHGIKEYPVQGSTGSYMLQIQPGQGGGENVAHDQVLSNGLLQDILSAIENQQKSENPYDNQPQGSEVQQVSATAAANASAERQEESVGKKPDMALFYSTRDDKSAPPIRIETLPSEINHLSVNEVSNGNFVSYKSPKVNYVYGDSMPQVVSQQSTPKTDEKAQPAR